MKFTIDIRHRWSTRVLFSAEIESSHNASDGLKLGAAVKKAYEAGADLTGADLRDADLRDADLSGADLSGADLSDANLSDANLSGADLSGADLTGADLTGADLRDADLSDADLSGADLSGADLSGADLSDANLSSADLRGADLSEILESVPLIPNIDVAILASIKANKAAGTNGLDMGSWHGNEEKANEAEWCETTHCRAGYAICLAGKAGFDLERKYGPANAGMFLYLKSTPNEPIPDWGASNKAAMADMKDRAARQTGGAP